MLSFTSYSMDPCPQEITNHILTVGEATEERLGQVRQRKQRRKQKGFGEKELLQTAWKGSLIEGPLIHCPPPPKGTASPKKSTKGGVDLHNLVV